MTFQGLLLSGWGGGGGGGWWNGFRFWDLGCFFGHMILSTGARIGKLRFWGPMMRASACWFGVGVLSEL